MAKRKTDGARRQDVLDFAKERFGTEPEYLWLPYPNYAVLRNTGNKKWYAIIMDVEKEKLGLSGDGKIDILDVKCSFAAQEIFLPQKGFLPAYHLNRNNWIGVLLDGTVDKETVFDLVESSVAATDGGKKARRTEPTDWLVPANPKYYDVEKAFRENEVISWKQSKSIQVGDVVYLYLGAPVSAVLYRCLVVEADIPFAYDDGKVKMQKVMKIRLLHRYDAAAFDLRVLRQHGVYSVRSPRGVPFRLRSELEAAADKKA